MFKNYKLKREQRIKQKKKIKEQRIKLEEKRWRENNNFAKAVVDYTIDNWEKTVRYIGCESETDINFFALRIKNQKIELWPWYITCAESYYKISSEHFDLLYSIKDKKREEINESNLNKIKKEINYNEEKI